MLEKRWDVSLGVGMCRGGERLSHAPLHFPRQSGCLVYMPPPENIQFVVASLPASPSAAASTPTTAPSHGSIGRGRGFFLGHGVVHQEGIQIERFGQNPGSHRGSADTERGKGCRILTATVVPNECGAQRTNYTCTYHTTTKGGF